MMIDTFHPNKGIIYSLKSPKWMIGDLSKDKINCQHLMMVFTVTKNSKCIPMGEVSLP